MLPILLTGALTLACSNGSSPADPAVQPAPERERFAIHAAKVLLGDGRVIEDGWVTVDDGRIAQIGRGVRVPEGWPVVVHDGVLTAGIVAWSTRIGLASSANETARSFLPDLRIADAVDPNRSDFEWLRGQGVTSLVVCPGAANVAGGHSAVVKTAGVEPLSEEAHVTLSLAMSSASRGIEPTSYGGALRMLEEALAAEDGPLAEAAAGKRPVLIHARARHEVQRASDFAARNELRGALLGAPRAGELTEALTASGLGVVLGPHGTGEDRRALKSAGALVEAGIPIAFSAGTETPVRAGVALCVREGLEPAAAWRALTSEAAALAGVSERVGRLEAGLDADLVLWDGDPIDLTSSVQAVYVDGALVHGSTR
jgi:imidazolonepropionase-like amidohydrolase